MEIALTVAAALILFVAIAHSWLGERYILTRLFRRSDLPQLFGSSEFTKRTLRFAWHGTSIAWLGLAGVLLAIAHPPVQTLMLGRIVGITFLIHGFIALFGSKGRHLSWIAFLLIGTLAIYATRG
jgi:hypothetical protein